MKIDLPLNKTELQDLDYLMEKVIKGKPFYALEISKAKYLLSRIKEIKSKQGRINEIRKKD